MYKESNIEIPKHIAGLMLSGIISDTLLLTSPTTTELDKVALEELAKIAGVDYKEYGMEMFKAGSSLEGKSISEIIHGDFKNFTIDNQKIGIGQVSTMSTDEIMSKKEEIIAELNNMHRNEDYKATALFITDILNNVPQKIEKFAGKMINSFEKEDVNRVFVKLKQNVFKSSEETAKAFHSIGLDADEMKKKFLEGGNSAKEAFSETIKRLRELDDEETRAFAGNTLFGTMWQDLGKEAILSMSSMRSFLSGKIFSFLKEKFQYLKNHMQEVKAVVAGLAGTFAGLKIITIAGKALKEVNKAGSITKFVFGALKTSLLANPFILVAAAIGVLVGAFVLLYQKSETFRTKVQELWSRLKEFATVIGSSVIGALQQLHSWFSEKIIPSLSQIGQSFMELCQTPFVSWITDVFVSGVGIAFQNFFTVINAVLPHVQGVIEGLLTVFNGVLIFLNGVFAGDWAKAWQGVKEIFSGIWESIKSIFLGVIEVIKGRINGITSQINNVAQKMSSLPIIGGLAQKINIPQFATGTQYFNGGTALVGEHGAELVNMPSGSKVTPADKTKQLLKSGNAVNVHITVQGNVIGNEQYANQLGSIIVQKVLAAQGNI